ncbi:MAG TPA: hypothetical protein VKC17_06090 [Sphingomicrobium sp.]|nr:hypothetical protein [Sphingomicrobium sp.]
MNSGEGAEDQVDGPLAALPDTYSRRKRMRSGAGDPLQYDVIPHKVRVQILHIVDATIKRISTQKFYELKARFYDEVRDFMRTEQGVLHLASGNYSHEEVRNWFLEHPETDDVVDCIEAICRRLFWVSSQWSSMQEFVPERVNEINARLLEAGVGFQFESGTMIEANSKYLHSELVVPALELLSDRRFAAPNSEFLGAHKAFREQDYEQCLVECCKAFESVIKVIAAERNWDVSPNAPAKTLVKAVFDNGLIPNYLESEFAGIRTVLENGIGTVRNKAGGHGAGTEVRVVARHLAAFQLHQTGAAITLLAEAHSA